MAEDKEKSMTDETLPKEPEEKKEGWDWDAAVPQTDTSNISFDDLQTAEVNLSESVEEEKAEDEKKEEEPEAVEEKSDDDGLCIVCGKPRGNSPSDLYCNECRAKFLRTNYGVGHIILAFVMVIVAALGYFVCTSTVTVSSKLYKAEQCVSERRYNDAVNLCSEILDATDKLNSGVNSVIKGVNSNAQSLDWFTEGKEATELILRAYANSITIDQSTRSQFTGLVDNYVSNGLYDLNQNPEIKKLYDLLKDVDKTDTALVGGLNKYITQKDDGGYDVKYNEAMKYLDSYKTTDSIQTSRVDFYRFLVAYYAEKDSKTLLGFIDQAYKDAGEYNYLYSQMYLSLAWQYKDYDKVLEIAKEATAFNLNDTSAYYYTVRVYVEKGDLSTADKMCEKMRESNPDGLDYYSTKAEILRRQNKLDEAIEICRKGIVAGSDSEIYRQQAIAYLLKSDKENALEAIKQSYELATQESENGISIQTANTVALICFICNDTKTYEEIEAMFKQSNMEFSDSVKKCIKGDITFEDIFMKGSGEIS